MADTLTRLAGPIAPSRSDAGSTLYTPKTGEIVALKNATLVNSDALKGAWAYMSIGAMTTASNLIIPGLYIPPGSIIKVDLDYIMNGGEVLYGRQVVDMSYTPNLVPALATPAISSTVDGTSFATASWAAVNSQAYLMFVVSTHANAAAAPTSFTDTHSGISWTQVGTTITNTLGIGAGTATMALSAWRAQSTGTTNTTTTANFGITATGCHIVILGVPGADVTGTNGSEAFQDGGNYTGNIATETAILIPGNKACGARIAGLSSNAGSTSTPGTGFTELSDAAIATPTNMFTTEYGLTPGAVATFTLNTTSTDKIGMLVNAQDGSSPVSVVLNGIVVKL